MSLTCHCEEKESPTMDVAPFEAIEAWFNDMAYVDDSTPLGRVPRSFSLDDVIP
jgi:hypothetical protein